MSLSKFFTSCSFALCLCVSLAACDGGDEGDAESSDTNNDGTTGSDETAGTGEDVDCSTYCVSYIEMCLQTGESVEYETDEACNAACGAWDQEGINCRHDQIGLGMCGEAGDMGSTCT